MRPVKPWVGLILAAVVAGSAGAAGKAGAAQRPRPDWPSGWLYATGTAPASEHDQDLTVHRAARLAAEASALTAVENLRVTPDATVKAFEAVADDLRPQIAALVHDARIVSQGPQGDPPLFAVTIAVPLRAGPDRARGEGGTSLAHLIFPRLAALRAKAVAAQKEIDQSKAAFSIQSVDASAYDTSAKAPPPTKPLPPQRPGPYTGLVLDTTAFHLQACMCPKIMRKDGSEVWGTVDVDSQYVIEHGIAGFVYDLDVALSPACRDRVGDNPLVLRAIGRQGSVWASAVISDEDAALLKSENAKTKFLDKFAVEFVIDKEE